MKMPSKEQIITATIAAIAAGVIIGLASSYGRKLPVVGETVAKVAGAAK